MLQPILLADESRPGMVAENLLNPIDHGFLEHEASIRITDYGMRQPIECLHLPAKGRP
ncbi:MAG: hypothetical protein BWZ01_03187 [Deltaproteobacteria bacterium ADurb.BinA179]|nr:MAG: hypothetical protein BWZ01_03187 [Deltaproteobacteria bacterium ADurb.BinA179]